MYCFAVNISERMLGFGSVIAGLGGTFGAGYLIWTLSEGLSFWTPIGLLSLAAIGTGLTVAAVGVVKRPKDLGQQGSGQVLSSGRGSTNYQAGRDIFVGNESDDDTDKAR
jgi:hypothetical protein